MENITTSDLRSPGRYLRIRRLGLRPYWVLTGSVAGEPVELSSRYVTRRALIHALRSGDAFRERDLRGIITTADLADLLRSVRRTH